MSNNIIDIKGITIGSDPEGFLVDGDNNFYPSEGLMGGSKYEPNVIKEGGYAIQEDNVMIEFNVPPTTLDNPKKLYADIQYVLDHISKRVADKNLSIKMVPSAYFDWKYLETEQARTFGCDPDYNAYTLDANQFTNRETNLRTAGGHVHIGYNEPEASKTLDIVRLLDLFLGVPSIILDKDTERRKMYGKAGCFRVTSFGLEYRVLSNFWTTSEESINWLFKGITQALEAYNKGFTIAPDSDLAKTIVKCINEQDETLAYQLCEEYNIVLELETVA